MPAWVPPLAAQQWGQTTTAGIVAGMMLGASREAARTQASSPFSMHNSHHQQQTAAPPSTTAAPSHSSHSARYATARLAAERRLVRVVRASVAGGAQLGALAGVFSASQLGLRALMLEWREEGVAQRRRTQEGGGSSSSSSSSGRSGEEGVGGSSRGWQGEELCEPDVASSVGAGAVTAGLVGLVGLNQSFRGVGSGAWEQRRVSGSGAWEQRRVSGSGAWEQRRVSGSGAWEQRRVSGSGAWEQRRVSGSGAWEQRRVSGSGAWEQRRVSGSGAWEQRRVSGSGAWEQRRVSGSGAWEQRRVSGSGAWEQRRVSGSGAWEQRRVSGSGAWEQRRVSGSGAWEQRRVSGSGAWEQRRVSGSGAWEQRRVSGSGAWEQRRVSGSGAYECDTILYLRVFSNLAMEAISRAGVAEVVGVAITTWMVPSMFCHHVGVEAISTAGVAEVVAPGMSLSGLEAALEWWGEARLSAGSREEDCVVGMGAKVADVRNEVWRAARVAGWHRATRASPAHRLKAGALHTVAGAALAFPLGESHLLRWFLRRLNSIEVIFEVVFEAHQKAASPAHRLKAAALHTVAGATPWLVLPLPSHWVSGTHHLRWYLRRLNSIAMVFKAPRKPPHVPSPQGGCPPTGRAAPLALTRGVLPCRHAHSHSLGAFRRAAMPTRTH
ncbi:unnamed protein product [Closterium sp. NIES-65]|nr:unnamed protein product [Closterium sp. NIES-65]